MTDMAESIEAFGKLQNIYHGASGAAGRHLTAAAFFPVVASTRAQLPLSVGLPGSLSRARIHHHQGLHITENPSASGSFEPGNQKEQRDP